MKKLTKKIAYTLIIALVLLTPAAVLFFRSSKNRCAETRKQKRPIAHTIRHLGLIMDGNRRWAKKHGLSPLEGHTRGCEPVKMAVRFCVDQKIPNLTLYALSLENFKRSTQELDHLFSLVEPGLSGSEFDEILSHGVRIRFVGDRSCIPERLHNTIKNLEEKTANGTVLNLNILFCYGGRQEVVAAVKAVAQDIQEKKYNIEAISENKIREHLWCSHSPDPDLVIRTGNDQRTSNFLLWQSAYSEFLFLEKFWPEITYQDLTDAVTRFTQRQRRFGK